MTFLASKSPQRIARHPISTIKIEFKKNNLYNPRLINLNNWKDQPLNVVKDPQNPNPKINLYFLETCNAFIKPNKKQPMILTIKISSICQRNIAPGIAPIEIRKNLFFSRKLRTYELPNKAPKAKEIMPKETEKVKSFNALKYLNFRSKSYMKWKKLRLWLGSGAVCGLYKFNIF